MNIIKSLIEKIKKVLEHWKKFTGEEMKVTRCNLTGLIILRSGVESCRIESSRKLPPLAKRLREHAKLGGISVNDFLPSLQYYAEENKRGQNFMAQITTGDLEPTMSVLDMLSKAVTVDAEKQSIEAGANTLSQWMKGVVQSAVLHLPNRSCPVLLSPNTEKVEKLLNHLFKPFPFLLRNSLSSCDELKKDGKQERLYLALVIRLSNGEFVRTRQILNRVLENNSLVSYIITSKVRMEALEKNTSFPHTYIEDVNLEELEKIEPIQVWRDVKRNLQQKMQPPKDKRNQKKKEG